MLGEDHNTQKLSDDNQLTQKLAGVQENKDKQQTELTPEKIKDAKTGCLISAGIIFVIGLFISLFGGSDEFDAYEECQKVITEKYISEPAKTSFATFSEARVSELKDSIIPGKIFKIKSFLTTPGHLGSETKYSFTCTMIKNNDGTWTCKNINFGGKDA